MRIRSFCSPEEIRKCTFDRQFAFHAHYKSLYTSRELLEKAAEQPDANIVLALAEQNHIIGYGVLAYPDPEERWADLGPEIMMEVTAIEVCRSWRSFKIASAILKMMVVSPSGRREDPLYGWIFVDLGFERDQEDSPTISPDAHQAL